MSSAVNRGGVVVVDLLCNALGWCWCNSSTGGARRSMRKLFRSPTSVKHTIVLQLL